MLDAGLDERVSVEDLAVEAEAVDALELLVHVGVAIDDRNGMTLCFELVCEISAYAAVAANHDVHTLTPSMSVVRLAPVSRSEQYRTMLVPTTTRVIKQFCCHAESREQNASHGSSAL